MIKPMVLHIRNHTITTSVLGIHKLFVPCLHSHFVRSMVWMFCRTVPEPHGYDESEEVARQAFQSEFQASQICFSDYPIFDWSHLTKDASTLSPRWAHYIRDIARRFNNNLKKLQIVYPKVQRVKSVSRETARLYQMFHPQCDIHKVTTRDIEVFLGECGYPIGGSAELRYAWKFNVMKPRFYYAQGGKLFFWAKYSKLLAVHLMDAVSTTETRRRTNPTEFIFPADDDVVLTWDYTAFTSSLSELKFFLYYLARALEELPSYPLRLFDYHEGLVERYAWEMIDDYNTNVNIHGEFSIHRVADNILQDIDSYVDYEQQNSGMLGYAGNIGFSTALHGTVLGSALSDPSKGVCVGDDGLGADPVPEEHLIPQLQMLGILEPTKLGRIEPHSDDSIRFIKRGVSRGADNTLYLDMLLNLPLAPYVDEIYGQRTIPPDMDAYGRYRKVVTQVGSCLWSIFDNKGLGDQDLKLLHLFLSKIYFVMGMSMRGGVSGQVKYRGDDGKRYNLNLCVPSLEFENYDPRETDWAEYLCDQYMGTSVRIPVYSEPFGMVCPDVDDVVLTTSHQGIRALEDMKYVEIEEVWETVTLGGPNRRSLLRLLGRVKDRRKKLVYVTCKRPIPVKYHFIFDLSRGDPNRGSVSDIWDLL